MNNNTNKTKYIVITGGVLSGIGKGVIASSMGVLMQAVGLNVTHIKIDPYLNIDAGTMNPIEHGEVFVLDDGGEVDLDLGNYERFSSVTLTKDHNITTGKIYDRVIRKERKGDYLGKTVQIIPHITDEIQDWIITVSKIPVKDNNKTPNVCIIELGGTVGDIESMPFIEAMRQFQFRVGKNNFCLLHVSLVPEMGGSNKEQKTKPTQQTIRTLMSLGLSANFILCRSKSCLIKETKKKISNFCHVFPKDVIGVHNVSNIYRVPLLLKEQNLDRKILKLFDLPYSASSASHINDFTSGWKRWCQLVESVDNSQSPLKSNSKIVTIAIVGKYTSLDDSYHSVIKALEHACYHLKVSLSISWIDSEQLYLNDIDIWEKMKESNGILVPGGFGNRGIEGKILAAKYARENGIPYLGICLGMQTAVIEYARNVLSWKNATSQEFPLSSSDEERYVVIKMEEFSPSKKMGGTMRLGSSTTRIKHKESKIARLYGGEEFIKERHRHRYEVNPKYVSLFEAKGLAFVGVDNDTFEMERNEICEIVGDNNCEYFVGVQFHPEFKSRPLNPSPPFIGLILFSAGMDFEEYLKNI